ncbi:MAG TPA: LacI family transcriptional regulator [Bacteroidetes bacterium]|nr:LacI family transcriptional regulator [Bacteroidota bacterium]
MFLYKGRRVGSYHAIPHSDWILEPSGCAWNICVFRLPVASKKDLTNGDESFIFAQRIVQRAFRGFLPIAVPSTSSILPAETPNCLFESGSSRYGKLKNTIADIAKKAGASVTTVSRVLNQKAGKYRISKTTAKRILKTAEELNYRPNQLARSLRLKKTHSIGLIVPDISNPFFAYVTRSIQRAAHRLGYSLVVCDTDENLPLEVEHLGFLVSKGVDGLIIMPVGQEYSHLESLVHDSLPMVLVDRCFDALEVSSVVIDNHKGAFEAVDHLIQHGHKRIAIIQGLPNTYSNNGRVQGYKDALTKHGIAIDPTLIVGSDFRQETGYIEAKLLLKRSDPPTAILAASDLITLGALQAIHEEGHAIPNEVSLIAFDDFEFAPYLKCALTAIAQPKENMGEIAVKLLVDQIKSHSKRPAQKIVLKPVLIARDSVRHISHMEESRNAIAL